MQASFIRSKDINFKRNGEIIFPILTQGKPYKHQQGLAGRKSPHFARKISNGHRLGLNPNRSLQHRFFNFILETCSPAACSRLPASCPLFFLDVARYACKKTTANLLGQPTTISSGSNDRFGLKNNSNKNPAPYSEMGREILWEMKFLRLFCLCL